MRLSRAAIAAAPLVFVFLWSTGFVGAKFGLPYIEPMTFLAVRMALVVVLMVAIVAVTGAPWLDRVETAHSAVTGILMHGIYLGGVFISINQGVPSGIAALIPGMQPLVTSTIANRWLGEPVRPVQWFGLCLGLAGVALVLHDRTLVGTGGWIGWAGSFVALLAISIGTLYQKRFSGGIDWRSGNLVQYAAATIVLTAVAFAFEDRVIQWTGELVFAIVWLAVVLSIGAIGLMYWIIRRAPAAGFSSLFYLVPAVTALMAYYLFDEKLDALSLAGMAVCALGVVLVNRGAARTD